MHRKKRKKRKEKNRKRQYNQPSSTFSFSLFSLASYVTCACALHSHQINSPPGREPIVLVIVPTDNCKAIKVVNDCLLREISENGNCCAPCDVMIAACPVQTNNCNNGRLFREVLCRARELPGAQQNTKFPAKCLCTKMRPAFIPD